MQRRRVHRASGQKTHPHFCQRNFLRLAGRCSQRFGNLSMPRPDQISVEWSVNFPLFFQWILRRNLSFFFTFQPSEPQSVIQFTVAQSNSLCLIRTPAIHKQSCRSASSPARSASPKGHSHRKIFIVIFKIMRFFQRLLSSVRLSLACRVHSRHLLCHPDWLVFRNNDLNNFENQF